MVVEVGVQARPEPVEERDGAELGLGPGAWTAVAERPAERPEQDVEHGPGGRRIPVQEVAETLRDRQHPLADRDGRDHVVGEVGSGRRHAPRVAGGTDAPALAGEGDQEVVAAAGTSGASEAVGQDPAPEVGTELGLHEIRDGVSEGIGLLGPGQIRLQVTPHEPVQGRPLGPSSAVHA